MGRSFEGFLSDTLAEWRARGLERLLPLIEGTATPRFRIGRQELVNFSSNDYLGLANDPLLKAAAQQAVADYGVGAGASRHVCGNLAPYAVLENKLARFKNKEAVVVFGSGYAANVGVISALVGAGDTVILDKLCHASIVDGARLSGATLRVYPHKNLNRLEELLRHSTMDRGASGVTRHRQLTPNILIITETVFSMDGDIAPLEGIVELKEKYGAWLMIDEAHATGLFGRNRRGVAEEAGVENHVEITMGTLSKALGCQGGYVAGSAALGDLLRNKARSLIYSTAMPPAIVAAAAAAVDLVTSDSGAKRCDKLWRNVAEVKDRLAKLGIRTETASPIIPLVVGEERAAVEMSERLFQQGVFIPAIRFPTVPKGKARLRLTISAAHSSADIQQLADALRSIGAKSGEGDNQASSCRSIPSV